MLELGQKYTHSFSYSQEQVNEFARVTGDNNPVHLDEVTEEWFISLDDNDFGTIKNIIQNRKI